ncbi:hypothetical protein H4R33_000368 [Dimargaris cristalligena]|uniref:cyclic pyranopterin monophosphate synthase n=1 Tax=Dimargaris cristalligena TaxID=215637 RepID=A0A4Q0A2R7_9FUNG|nr:hypothetical protein H4R33_000368 [Dimargaris cristalligena]RKP40384.1 Molybdopterin cofactor biosynthesis C domain-containing protein [Dimargaris cristalligena]|eukprot:RKP40384.1 Molybdopterin cofactor biosynthesis C domain-containing protein [Dimargaris cristalligena]
MHQSPGLLQPRLLARLRRSFLGNPRNHRNYYSTRAPGAESPLSTPAELTHVDPQSGRLNMVDVSDKPPTRRQALARGQVLLHDRKAFEAVQRQAIRKGDVLTVGQVAGIQGAKLTAQLIPLCHPIALTDIQVQLRLNEADLAVELESSTMCAAEKTGVEMEALTAVAVAGLTVIDMCKSVARGATLTNVRVVYKTGGRSGTYQEASALPEQPL